MDFITVREITVKWDISQRRAQKLCEEGRIQGVLRFGKSWMIPSDAKKHTYPRKIRKKEFTAYDDEP